MIPFQFLRFLGAGSSGHCFSFDELGKREYNRAIIKKEASSMNTIITIGRQFGSGGREIGIRLAKA